MTKLSYDQHFALLNNFAKTRAGVAMIIENIVTPQRALLFLATAVLDGFHRSPFSRRAVDAERRRVVDIRCVPC